MDIQTFDEFLQYAKEKEREERIFQQWLIQIPAMQMAGKKSYVPYEEYRDNAMGKSFDLRDKEVIEAEISAIEEQFKGR